MRLRRFGSNDSEPRAPERIFSVSEVATIFIKSLIQSTEDFLNKKFQGTITTVPATFTNVQRTALEKAVTYAGVKVFQLLDEADAAAATTTTNLWNSNPQAYTQLVVTVDLGSSSLLLSLYSLYEKD